MQGTFYTYVHCNEKDIPFYVGKGTKLRAYDTKARGKIWKDYTKKHPFNLFKTRIYYCDSEAQAFELEKELICLLRSQMGLWLANATDGGEGIAGYTYKRSRKISKTEEHRKNISLSQKGKSRNPASIAKMKRTRQEQCSKMTLEEKSKRNKIIKLSLKSYWENLSENTSKLRNKKISQALKNRTPEQKALQGAKGWETRRRNKQKELTHVTT